MTQAFNPRVVIVGVQINGTWHYFQNLDIRVQGQRFWSGTAAFCTIRLSNLTREERNWLLTNASPVLAKGSKPANVSVDVGREIGGVFRLFQGTCYTSTVTPPPDIGITFRTLDSSALASAIQPNSLGALTRLSTIAQYVAQHTGNILDFQVTTDINVANFTFPSNTNDLIPRLNRIGGITATAYNGTLVVRDANGFNKNRGFVLSQDTGMVGMPQACESGCIAQMLVQGDVQIGDLITVKSVKNPSVNGSYRVSQIAFDIANRDAPFFYTLTLTSRFAETGPV
jgi:hypothetical protein